MKYISVYSGYKENTGLTIYVKKSQTVNAILTPFYSSETQIVAYKNAANNAKNTVADLEVNQKTKEKAKTQTSCVVLSHCCIKNLYFFSKNPKSTLYVDPTKCINQRNF